VVVPGYDEQTGTWSVSVVNSYTYTPFGGFYDGEEPLGPDDNPFKFTGQWHDDEIDQYYLRARMYDPAMMRFTGRDPVRGENNEPLTLHKYLYCGNEPMGRIDPTGNTYSVAETIEAGYGNHYAVITVVGYGVATLNWDAITLGIALDRVTKEVMLLTAFRHKPRVDDPTASTRQKVWDNQQGNFNPGGMKGWALLGVAYLYIEGNQDFLWTRTAVELIGDAFVFFYGDDANAEPRSDGSLSE
jgi:RHS repeat-associated protein